MSRDRLPYQRSDDVIMLYDKTTGWDVTWSRLLLIKTIQDKTTLIFLYKMTIRRKFQSYELLKTCSHW